MRDCGVCGSADRYPASALRALTRRCVGYRHVCDYAGDCSGTGNFHLLSTLCLQMHSAFVLSRNAALFQMLADQSRVSVRGWWIAGMHRKWISDSGNWKTKIKSENSDFLAKKVNGLYIFLIFKNIRCVIN